MRKDLGMRKGKMIAQGCHASMAVLTNRLKNGTFVLGKDGHPALSEDFEITDDPVHKWFEGAFTKIALGCQSEEELFELEKAAIEANIPCEVICDAGLTEFDGIPTNTCIAIGPWWNDEIDKLTGDLKLL